MYQIFKNNAIKPVKLTTENVELSSGILIFLLIFQVTRPVRKTFRFQSGQN